MRIIDIEGTDGSGKKTQTELLYNFLTNKGYKCKLISFPNYESNSSALVKMYLNGEFGDGETILNGYQVSTFYAVDRLATMSRIDINNYDFILFDRYTPSNMIHQSTRIHDINELVKFLDWCDEFEYNTLKLHRPTDILFLDMPVDISMSLANKRGALKNGQQKDIIEANSQHLINAYNNAKFIANRFGWHTIKCFDKKLKSIDEIHQEILTKLGLK